MKIRISLPFISTAFALFISSAGMAQPIFFGDTDRSALGFEIRKPDFDNESISGTSFFFNVDARISDRLKLLFELPMTFFEQDNNPPFVNSFSESSAGNLLIGIRTIPRLSELYFEGGLRLPTASEDKRSALFSGMLTDYHRSDAFLADYFVLKGALGIKTENNRGLVGKFKIGPSLWVETSSNDDIDNELALNYNGHLLFIGEVVNFGGGLSGISILTENNDNTEMLFDLSLSFNARQVRPGIELHFPLTDNLNDFVDTIIGLGVEFRLR